MLLKTSRAAVYKKYPFTIILREERPAAENQGYILKIDPGTSSTGMAIVSGASEVVWAAELRHRGVRVMIGMRARKANRRFRRYRGRYRQPRPHHRNKHDTFLPPSLLSRMRNVLTWAERIANICPVSNIYLEFNSFGQIARNRGVLSSKTSGCHYCGVAGVPLENEHVWPRSKGGSNGAYNIVPSCRACNVSKGSSILTGFEYPSSARGSANSNRIKHFMLGALRGVGPEVCTYSGLTTKKFREMFGLPKQHWVDAVCVGGLPSSPRTKSLQCPLVIKAMGHGSRRIVQLDKNGFPRQHRIRVRPGRDEIGTGDYAEVVAKRGRHAGRRFIGRVTVKRNSVCKLGPCEADSKNFRVLQKADGYAYE